MVRVAYAALLLILSTVAQAAAPVLVETDWLAGHLKDKSLVVVDMTDGDTQYVRFHIPGAVRLPYEELVQERGRGNATKPLSAPALSALLGRLGITREHYVLIYDDMGGLNAGRLFWELERAGHPRVSVLNGGLVKWVLEGRPVTNEPALPVPTRYTLADAGRDNSASLEDVKNIAREGNAVLLDVRSKEEYLGHPKVKRSGHVPGARLWPWEQAVEVGQGFVRAEAAGLVRSLEKVGVDGKQAIVLYCRSGHRAAQSYLTLRSLGYEQVEVFAGSMLEYAADPKAPIKQGAHP